MLIAQVFYWDVHFVLYVYLQLDFSQLLSVQWEIYVSGNIFEIIVFLKFAYLHTLNTFIRFSGQKASNQNYLLVPSVM